MGTGLRLTPADSASTPDNPALDITGDIDFRMALSLDDWTPASPVRLLFKGDFGTNQFSYHWYFRHSPSRQFLISSSRTGQDADAISHIVSAGSVPTTDGNRLGIRSVLDVSFGAFNNSRILGYYKLLDCDGALDDIESDSGWTLTGESTLGNLGFPISLWSGTEPLVIGDGIVHGLGDDGISGCVFAVVVKDGINGTTVANPDFTTNPSSPFTDSAGRTWTLSAGALIDSACCDETDFWGWATDFGTESQGWTVIS